MKDKTKNASSRRSFPLTPETRELFLRIKEDEARNRRLFGKGYGQNPYVFKRPDGKPYAPEYVSNKFRDLLV